MKNSKCCVPYVCAGCGCKQACERHNILIVPIHSSPFVKCVYSLIYIHYALHFADNTEGTGHITHTATGTSETSTESKHSGVYYKMFLFNMFHFQLFAKYGWHQGFQLYNFGNSLLICSSKYFSL